MLWTILYRSKLCLNLKAQLERHSRNPGSLIWALWVSHMGDQMGSESSTFTGKVLNGSLCVGRRKLMCWEKAQCFQDSQRASQLPTTPCPLPKVKRLQKVKPFKGQFLPLGKCFFADVSRGKVDPRWVRGDPGWEGPHIQGLAIRKHSGTMMVDFSSIWEEILLILEQQDVGYDRQREEAGLGPGWNNPSASTQKISCWHQASVRTGIWPRTCLLNLY